ncbi:MAG: hypothetical protein KC731_14685 [Myxococcales bacterium]|nr:hypothetical protein [Myxococcales bacterium]
MQHTHAGICLLFITTLGAAGCSSTACDDALDKVEDCGFEDVSLNADGEECAERAACQADCVLAGSCSEIQDAVTGQDNDVAACIAGC